MSSSAPFQLREFQIDDLARVPRGQIELSQCVPEAITPTELSNGSGVRGFTAFRDEAVYGCLGMSHIVADAEAWFVWAILSDDVRAYPIWCYKTAISLLDILSKNTNGLSLYALIQEDSPEAHRFAKRVGFESTHWWRRFPPAEGAYELYRYK